jgi:hypothetical protein
MEMFFMTQPNVPLVKLFLANSYYYNCGMLLTNSVELPTEETDIIEKLREIQCEGRNGYVVLRGETQLRCSIPEDLDIFELNNKLSKFTDKEKEIAMVISKLDNLSLMSIVDQSLSKKYEIYENVASEEDFGRKLYQEDQLSFEIPKQLANYIDFKKLGRAACEQYSIRIIPEMKLAERRCRAN